MYDCNPYWLLIFFTLKISHPVRVHLFYHQLSILVYTWQLICEINILENQCCTLFFYLKISNKLFFYMISWLVSYSHKVYYGLDSIIWKKEHFQSNHCEEYTSLILQRKKNRVWLDTCNYNHPIAKNALEESIIYSFMYYFSLLHLMINNFI